MLPSILFNTWVLIHSPTPHMHFYQCPQQGRVIGFADVIGETGTIQYEVQFKCKYGVRFDWLHENNVRPMEKKK